MLFDKLFKKPEPKYIEIPEPIYPLLFKVKAVPEGTSYECHFMPHFMRETVIKNLKPDDEVIIQEGTWERKKVLYVLNRAGTDVGMLSDSYYKYLTSVVKNLQIRATVVQIDPLVLTLEVHGEYKKKWDFYDGTPGERGKEYTYGVIASSEHLNIPPAEIMCQLVLLEDTYVIKAAGMMVGTIKPERTEKLEGMLHKYHCITTVSAEPHNYDTSVKMTLRF